MASLSEANQILGQLIVDIQSTHAEDITTLLEDKKRLEAKLQGWKRDANKYEAALHAMLPSNQTFNDPLDQQSNEDFDQAFECEIMLDYQKIKMAIEGWVHDAVADSEDNALYEYFKQQRNGVETTQGSRMQRFLYENELEKMGPHRYSNHFILTVLIHYGLSHSLRFKHYPIGISHAQAQFMLGIEMGISYLHSPRDLAIIDKWKSVTLPALNANPLFRETRKAYMEAILKEATQLLSSVPSAKYTTLGKLESSFRTQILDPMVELYGKLSPSLRYHFINVISIYPQHMLERCTLKNVNTWDSVTKEDQVGRALQCLHPGICRAQSGVDWPSGDWPSTVIVKPVIVITNPEGRTDLHPGIRRAQSGVGWPSTVIVKPVIVITNPEGRPGIYI